MLAATQLIFQMFSMVIESTDVEPMDKKGQLYILVHKLAG